MIASLRERARSTLSRDPRRVREAVGRIRQDERITGQAGWNDRRASRRIRVQKAVYVTPVWVQAGLLRVPEDDKHSFIARTSDLSHHGIGLLHDDPLESRYALVTFELQPHKLVSLLIELRWSRRRADRRHTTGGYIVTTTETPALVREFALERPLPQFTEESGSHEPGPQSSRPLDDGSQDCSAGPPSRIRSIPPSRVARTGKLACSTIEPGAYP